MLFIIVYFTPLTENLYKPLIFNDTLHEKKQVIVILSAGMYESDLLDFRTMVRLRKGLELYKQGKADKIICAGGVRVEGTPKSIAAIMKDTLILLGVPGDKILIEDETINTFNDITHTIEKFRSEFDFNRAVFVTSSYHTFRVKKILLRKDIHAAVVSAEPYELYPQFRSERPEFLREVVREYMAICYFKIKGWI